MSHLPEPGDVKVAVDMMNARSEARGMRGEKPISAGTVFVDFEAGSVALNQADTLLSVYGDLFDVAELLQEGGAMMVRNYLHDIVTGDHDPLSALSSLLFQGVAIGVLMERARWERER